MMRRLRIALCSVVGLALAISSAAAPARAGGSTYNPTDAERARWTMSDMRSWVIALAAYHKDNGTYPRADSIEALVPFIQPRYIRKAPATDAWGTGFRYVATADQTGFRIISAGSDGAFDETTWAREASDLGFDQDAVADAGAMTRVWQYR
jgi:hypothetical protein